MKDLTDLRKIAEEVDNSPWAVQESFKNGGARVIDANGFALPGCFNCGENDAVYEEVDATHIATFDPPAVLDLLTRLEQAEAAVARVREAVKDAPTEDPTRGFAGPPDDYPDIGDFIGNGEWTVADRVRRALDGEQG